jgi:hypothetical protein
MDWDAVREVAPFLVGMVLPPLLMLVVRMQWSGLRKFAVTFLPALVLGVITSAWAGELILGMPDSLVAVIIDTALVYTGSQIAYQLLWKPVLEARFVCGAASKEMRVGE